MMRIDRMKLSVALMKKDMSQRDLSKDCGVSEVTISCIMSGKRCSDKTGRKIAATLGVDVTEIIE